MILGTIKRILKEDLARIADVPAWVDSLLLPLNQFIDTVAQALRNQLTFRDNFSCRELTLSFQHGVAQKVNPQSSVKVKGILVVDPGGQVLTGYGFTRNGDSTINVTLTFLGGTSATHSTCTIEVLLG